VDDEFNDLLNEIKKYNGLTNNGDTVLLTNGSDNALRLILQLFATPDTTVLMPVPSYVHFEYVLNTFEVKSVTKPYIHYTLTNTEVNDLLLDELTKGYDVCYIVNPSMPIGHILTHDNIQNMLKIHSNTLFVIDEAYLEFSSSCSCANLIEEFNNLIVVKTFSKFFSLASLRIGYLMSNANIVSLLKPFYNYKDITKMSVSCALSSLKNVDFYKNNKKDFLNIKQYIINNLNDLVKNNKIKNFIFNEGMYFTIICEDPADLKNYFDKNNIAVRNKNCDITGALRITVGNYENMENVFNVLKDY
jgi:histidinol-phosphate aminotransferase